MTNEEEKAAFLREVQAIIDYHKEYFKRWKLIQEYPRADESYAELRKDDYYRSAVNKAMGYRYFD